MKIAQVAPLFESVPPKAYGGTERVVSYLTEALVELGHDVTLFASGDSLTRARSWCRWSSAACGCDPRRPDWLMWHTIMLDQVFEQAPRVRRDPLPRRLPALSAGAPLPDAVPDHAARPARPARPGCRCTGTSASSRWCRSRDASASRWPTPLDRHGASRPARSDLYRFHRRAGRLLRVPRPHLAGEARRPRDRDRHGRGHAAAHRGQGRPASTRATSSARSARCSTTRWSSSSARSTRPQKDDFLGDARALLFPIDWPEPFGLVMIEALACGTPVIAYRCGSVPEVHRARRHRLHRRRPASRRSRPRGASMRIDRRALPRRLRAPLHGAPHGRRYLEVYQPLSAARAGRAARCAAQPLLTARARHEPACIQSKREIETSNASRSTTAGTCWPPARAPRNSRRCSSTTRLFALFDRFGDIAPLGRAASRASTTRTRASCRTSSCCSTACGPLLLSTAVKDDDSVLTVDLMNPDLQRDGQVACQGHACTSCARKLLWDGACYEHLRVANYGRQPRRSCASRAAVRRRLRRRVRGARHAARAARRSSPARERDATAAGARLRGARRRAGAAPSCASSRRRTQLDQAAARLHAAPGAGRTEHLCAGRSSASSAGRARRAPALSYDDALGAQRRPHAADRAAARCRVEQLQPADEPLARALGVRPRHADHRAADRALSVRRRALVLHDLRPRRLLTALQCLWLRPELARGVLAFLAATQATAETPSTTPSPARSCTRRAAARWRPRARSRSAATTAPSTRRRCSSCWRRAYWRRTGDLEFVRTLWPNVAARRWSGSTATATATATASSSTRARSDDGLVQQGWKDSHDSVFHADGRWRSRRSRCARCRATSTRPSSARPSWREALGEHERGRRAGAARPQALQAALRAALLVRGARHLRAGARRREAAVPGAAVERRPCAVDGHRRARARGAHGASACWSPTCSPAGACARWRAGEARYNPMSYHNGSIWPHDNALIARAWRATATPMRRWRCCARPSTQRCTSSGTPARAVLRLSAPRRRGADALPGGLLAAGVGRGRRVRHAAGCLGLEIDAAAARVRLHSPRLPAFVDWLRIEEPARRRGAASTCCCSATATTSASTSRNARATSRSRWWCDGVQRPRGRCTLKVVRPAPTARQPCRRARARSAATM